jgi:hypothetical protein
LRPHTPDLSTPGAPHLPWNKQATVLLQYYNDGLLSLSSVHCRCSNQVQGPTRMSVRRSVVQIRRRVSCSFYSLAIWPTMGLFGFVAQCSHG